MHNKNEHFLKIKETIMFKNSSRGVLNILYVKDLLSTSAAASLLNT